MRRFRALEDLQKAVVGDINQKFIGQNEKCSEQIENRWRGRTPTNRLVFVNRTKTSMATENGQN